MKVFPLKKAKLFKYVRFQNNDFTDKLIVKDNEDIEIWFVPGVGILGKRYDKRISKNFQYGIGLNNIEHFEPLNEIDFNVKIDDGKIKPNNK